MVRVGYLITLLFLLLFGIAPAVRRVRRVVIAGEGQSMELNETDQDNNSAFAIEAGIDATRDMQANEDDDTEIKTTMAQGFANLDSFGEQTLRTDEDEEDKTLNDLLKKVNIHLPYYMQLFTPVFHGEDHRLPAKALSQPYPATALSELHQADEEPDEPKKTRNIPIGQSLMQDEERVRPSEEKERGTTSAAKSQPEVQTDQCAECQSFINKIILGCCVKKSKKFRCDMRICEQRNGIKYSNMTKQFKHLERFRRLYMDFTALGSILHNAEEKDPKQLCNLYMTETYNCDGRDDKVDERMPTKVISIRDYRNDVCKGVTEGWRTMRMCTSDVLYQTGDVAQIEAYQLGEEKEKQNKPAGNKNKLKHLESDNDVVSDNDAFGLGFPEVPIKWDPKKKWYADDQDKWGFMDSNYRQSAKTWLALGNKSQKVHHDTVKKLIAGMPEPGKRSHEKLSDDDLRSIFNYWKGQEKWKWSGLSKNSRAIDSMKAMGIVLFDFKEKKFAVENIPFYLRKALKIIYKHADKFHNLRAKFKRSVGPDLQKIAYDSIEDHGYEDPSKKGDHIRTYIMDYRPDLTEAELLECKVGPPYYKPSGRFRGVTFTSDAHKSCVEEAVENFDNYNAFFARRLDPERRDYLCYDHDAKECKRKGEAKGLTFNEERPIIVSPADSRIILVSVLETSEFWIKGEHFNLKSLVSFDEEEHYTYYQNGRMLISRLAPQDYHRFHFPIDGTVTDFKHYPGAYYSVNPIAIGHEGTPVFHSNKRMHATIRSEEFGCVLYVSVAATNVGSIIHTSYVGQNVIRGMEHGFMQFGGSTVLIIFPEGVADFDKNIVDASGVPIETIVHMGATLGRSTGKTPRELSLSPCGDA